MKHLTNLWTHKRLNDFPSFSCSIKFTQSHKSFGYHPMFRCPSVKRETSRGSWLMADMVEEMFINWKGSTWRIIPGSKWLITMVSKSPKWGYSYSKWPFHGLQMWVTNHLLNGMILQVRYHQFSGASNSRSQGVLPSMPCHPLFIQAVAPDVAGCTCQAQHLGVRPLQKVREMSGKSRVKYSQFGQIPWIFSLFFVGQIKNVLLGGGNSKICLCSSLLGEDNPF